ncbi:hypothetical protein Pla108_39220 [Botrimarina colliarenosi]|uniref:Carboxypeptidase regulatory-like domain-containing protein n=1 Tax=Botrimarina colliarenosi TaxID=2528001 RepID=A0A5C6A2G7_9BACT|nr:hypothetical protein [Botrimarina colliarenosi]TWT93428.1 hypothetical protein Pla108_39220 [Botrimarina colliarenosi]
MPCEKTTNRSADATRPGYRMQRLAGGLILLLGLAATGCGSGAGKAEVVPVTGRVFLGDQPLGFGSVTFQPLQGGQPASGKIDADGKFVLSTYKPSDGAAVGQHRVRVVCYASQDPANAETPTGDALGELLTPSRYAGFANSGIQVSVLADGNAPFILKLEPDPPAEEVSPEDGDEAGTAAPAADDPATDDPATDEVPADERPTARVAPSAAEPQRPSEEEAASEAATEDQG